MACVALRSGVCGARSRRRVSIRAHMSNDSSRRHLLGAGIALAGASLGSGLGGSGRAEAASFSVVSDTQDGYKFIYPFGWQEMQVDGQEAVYKDVIESQESLNLTIAASTKTSVADYGDVNDTAKLFLDKVLVPPGSQYKLLAAKERDEGGYKYYQFEYETKGISDRHVLTTTVIGNGKLFVLTVGTLDRRWPKIGSRLVNVADSLSLLY